LPAAATMPLSSSVFMTPSDWTPLISATTPLDTGWRYATMARVSSAALVSRGLTWELISLEMNGAAVLEA